MNQKIETGKAPAAIGPYSQAVLSDGFLFVSGQLPIDPATGAFPSDDIGEQTRQSLTNIKAIVEEAGGSMSDIVKTTVLLADIGDFAAMNAVYATFFSGTCPARAAFGVAGLPKNARVEIEAVACIRK